MISISAMEITKYHYIYKFKQTSGWDQTSRQYNFLQTGTITGILGRIVLKIVISG